MTLKVNIFSQFVALLYKELLLRKCHYISTSFQIIFPIIIASIPCMVYNGLTEVRDQKRPKSEWVNFTTYEPKEVTTIYSGVRTEDLVFVYYPSNEATDEIMRDAVAAFFGRDNSGKNLAPKSANSEEELRKFILEEQKKNEEKIMIGTVFKDFKGGDKLPENLDYKIYYTKDFLTVNKYGLNGPNTYNAYGYSFFTRWQAAVGDTFIKKKSTENNKQIDYKIFMQTFPYPGYKNNPLTLAFMNDMELYIHLGLVFFAAVILKRLIEEKNDSSKELMETMGMTKFPYWASIFVNNFITAFIVTLIITIIHKTSIKGSFFHMESNFLLLFIILLFFMVNLILFCMTFSIFFNRVSFGVFALMTVYFLSHQSLMSTIYTRTPLEEYFSLSLFHKLCICLYPGGALMTSYLLIQIFESGKEGIQWHNLTEYPMVPDINMLMVIAMMVFSCFFYVFAIWYFDAVWPWQPGIRKQFYFFFKKSYWFGDTPTVVKEIELESNKNAVDNFEEEPQNAVKSVVIKDLSKVIRHGSSSKTILHDVSLICYQGQITTVLGYSGAGKTSIFNILAGKELPTKGSASITGLDIFTNMTRQLLGVCPQRNILYEEFSVEQHLKLYAAMKGTSLGQLSYEAEQVLSSLKLSSKRAETVSNLSYTDKRKLTLGIAVVGGSKVLLLDEPTYGMDNEAKRQVWDALITLKHERTVIVTTQSCEEADILGDRTVLMVGGEIQSCGTPAFIKQKLGAGYHLHVLKDVNFDVQGLQSLVTKHVSTATGKNESHKEVSFNLGSSSELGDMFQELDSRKNDLGIISYGVSLSTIRDVFLEVSKISHMKQTFSASGITESTSTETEDVIKDPFHPALHASLGNQFQALLLKHFHYCKKRWKFLIIQLAVPFFLMLTCFYCLKISTKSRYQPLKLDISSVYGTTDGFYYNNDKSLSYVADAFKKVLESNSVNVEKVPEPTHYVLNYGNKNLAKYLKRLAVGGAFDKLSSGSLNLTAWYNLGSIHSMPMSLLLMQTTLLRLVTDTGSMSLAIEPIISIREKVKYEDFTFPPSAWVPYFVPLAFTFLSLSFILVPSREKTTKAKLLQLMSGIPAPMYWIATFVWDYLIYLVICILLILPPAFFFPSIFFGAHSEAIGTLLLFFLLYGWASLPLGYIVSSLLKQENRGHFVFIGFCILFSIFSITMMTNISAYLFMMKDERPYGLQDAYWFFRLFPMYSISTGVLYNFHIALNNAMCDVFTPEDFSRCKTASGSSSPTLFHCCKDLCHKKEYHDTCHETMNHLSLKKHESYISNGPEALFLGLEGIIFFAILFLLETRTATKALDIIKLHLESMWEQITRIVLRKEQQGLRHENLIDDPQVLQEEERIRNLTATQQGLGDESLAILGLAKKGGTSSSNARLTFGVNGEECFGIFGDGGAGKTSLFRMLTGDGLPFEGNAFIRSYSLIGDFRKFESHIGYCPEVDSLMDDLTGRETLLLFGQLRGLRDHELQNNVNEFIQSLGLTNRADELTQFYSGEEKRKLSVATALIGSPPVVLMDEPTAGVGSESRQQIWKVLTRNRKRSGAAILLGTQSIGEGDALCNRVAVMANGRFLRLASLDLLKSKQGHGYALIMKLNREHQNDVETVNALKNHVQNSLKNVTLTDNYQGKLQYHVMDPSITVGHLFKFMLEVKGQFEVEDYLISALSLEQIFHAGSPA